jgi:hypothetical protein
MLVFHRFALAALASFSLLGLSLPTPAASSSPPKTTRYFVAVPGNPIPVSISAFSSDAYANVGEFVAGEGSGARASHGKFSTKTDGSPFVAGKTFDTMVVVAQTPVKLVTFTFTHVTIDTVEATSASAQRVTFQADNYSVKFSREKGASSGQPAS